MMNMQVSEDIVLAVYRQLLQQWNKRDAGGMAGLFAENGTLVGFDGSQLNGQKEIYAVLDEIFANFPTASYVSIVKEVRTLSADSAMLLAVAGMIAEGHSDITPSVNAVQTLVVSIEKNQPRIALFQNTPAAFHGRPELSEQLSADLRAAMNGALTDNTATES
jgi:uncharacterized protein (TIGR02246 family)